MTETSHLLVKRLGADALVRFLFLYESRFFQVFVPDLALAPRMKKLVADYADLPMDLADASLVVLAEQLGHGKILSTDRRDFKTYRWKNTKPFENLLAE
jgi:predicted nucleic acid-binding protein